MLHPHASLEDSTRPSVRGVQADDVVGCQLQGYGFVWHQPPVVNAEKYVSLVWGQLPAAGEACRADQDISKIVTEARATGSGKSDCCSARPSCVRRQQHTLETYAPQICLLAWLGPALSTCTLNQPLHATLTSCERTSRVVYVPVNLQGCQTLWEGPCIAPHVLHLTSAQQLWHCRQLLLLHLRK